MDTEAEVVDRHEITEAPAQPLDNDGIVATPRMADRGGSRVLAALSAGEMADEAVFESGGYRLQILRLQSDSAQIRCFLCLGDQSHPLTLQGGVQHTG